MSTGFTVYIIIQFIVSVALVYGYMHEKEVIAFEDKLWARIKAALHKKQPESHPEKKQATESDLTLVADSVYNPYSCFDYVA